MANDLVVRLLLKSGAFSNDLRVAKGQIQNFQSGCKTAGQSVQGFTKALGLNISSIGKLGGAVGIAVAAGKEFKAVIESSQTTADAFQVAIAGAKGVLDGFNTSLASGDFTMFSNGLWQVIEDAKELARTLDQLGNTQIAFDYMSKENQTKFQEAYTLFKDPTATEEMKEAAKKQMKEAIDAQYEYAENYNKIVYQSYVAQVVKKAGSANIQAFRVTKEQFRKAMLIDLSDDPQKARDDNEREYKKYKSQLKEYGKNNLTAQEQLKKRYADVIAIHAMLELMKDDELKGLGELLGGMEAAKQSAIAMEKTYNRALGKSGGTTTTKAPVTKSIEDEIKAQQNSLAYWKDIEAEAQKHRDAEVFNSEGWNKYNDKLKEAKGKIEEIEAATARLGRTPIEPLPKIDLPMGKAVVMNEPGLAQKSDPRQSIKQMRERVQQLQELRDALKEGDSMIITYNKQIDELYEKINTLTNLGSGGNVGEGINAVAGAMTNFSNVVSNMSNAFHQLNNDLEENADGWTTLMDVYNIAVSVMSSVATIIQTINTLNELQGTIAMTTAGEVAAAKTTEASATAAAASTQIAANTAVAASGAAASQASIPFIGPILAAAAVAAVIAAIIAGVSKGKSVNNFANGGIVPGTSFTGDRVSANVNSGEMILNRTQQHKLWNQINNGGQGGKQVEFHISGTDLVGVLNNNNRKSRLTR